ncbi:hypothetical protein HY793_00670 [Candidatus Desantisbacteria bacterium]|nr:hypothetical protein [Candidatus Desantisbacteria bacterium]
MQVTLTHDIENVITEWAHKQGTTPEMLVINTLRERFVSPVVNRLQIEKQETLADFLVGHIGVLSSSEHIAGGARMSENCGKKFASGVIKKRQDGKL